VIEGAVVGAIGAIAGMVLGLAACFVGNYFQLVSLPPDVYSISNVPLNATISETLIAALVAFVLSVLATIYPARAAARLRPVEALRDG
jgi:lipoprotein-releasing system permease protein